MAEKRRGAFSSDSIEPSASFATSALKEDARCAMMPWVANHTRLGEFPASVCHVDWRNAMCFGKGPEEVTLRWNLNASRSPPA